MHDKLVDIPISQLVEPRLLLRLVSKDSIDYLELRDSIRDQGLINSICVRPASEPDHFEIIDGLWRFTCAQELGLASVPCIVKYNVSDDDVLILQLQANSIGRETSPVEYAQQLKNLLKRRPEMTLDELAHIVRKSPRWVSERLGLLRLNKSLQKMVDRGEIKLRSAYMLAKIPSHLQPQYVDQARAMSVSKFIALAASVIKTFAEAVKQGKMDAFYQSQFNAQPHLRPLKAILSEMDLKEEGPLLVVSENCKTPTDGFYAALRWVSHLDRGSVLAQEAAARGRVIERTVTDASPLG